MKQLTIETHSTAVCLCYRMIRGSSCFLIDLASTLITEIQVRKPLFGFLLWKTTSHHQRSKKQESIAVCPSEFLRQWIEPLSQSVTSELSIARDHETALIAIAAEFFHQLIMRVVQSSSGKSRRNSKALLNKNSVAKREEWIWVEQPKNSLGLPDLSLECLQSLLRGMSSSMSSQLLIHFMLPTLQIVSSQPRLKKSTGMAIAALIYELFVDLFNHSALSDLEQSSVYCTFIEKILSKVSLATLRIAAVRLLEHLLIKQTFLVFDKLHSTDPPLSQDSSSALLLNMVNVLLRSMERDPGMDVR